MCGSGIKQYIVLHFKECFFGSAPSFGCEENESNGLFLLDETQVLLPSIFDLATGYFIDKLTQHIPILLILRLDGFHPFGSHNGDQMRYSMQTSMS